MRQIPRHCDDVILNISKIKSDIASGRHLPLLIAPLRKPFDDIRFVAQESVQAHDFLAALAHTEKHIFSGPASVSLDFGVVHGLLAVAVRLFLL